MKPLLALVLVLTACAAPGSPSERYDLVVEQVLVPGGPMFIEGTFSEVRVDGEVPVAPGEPDSTVTLRGLSAGTHLVEPALRPCDGNCGSLGGRTGACRLEVEVPATRSLRVRYRTDGPCEVEPA